MSIHLDVHKIWIRSIVKESIPLEKRTWYFCNPEHHLNHAENTHPCE